MEESGCNFGLNGVFSSHTESEQETNNVQFEARQLTMQRGLQSLVHACQCSNADCQLPSCQKMKCVVQHTKLCKRKTEGGCPICKHLLALCCYHAKHCLVQETECPVPFCVHIKHKLKHPELKRVQRAQLYWQRLQRAQLVRQRMTAMQTATVPTFGEGPNMSQQQLQILQQLEAFGSIVAGASGGSGNPPGGSARQQMIATFKAFKKQRQAFQMAQAANQNQAANAGQVPGGVMVPNQQPQHLLQHMISQQQQQQQQQPGTPGGIVAGASGVSGNASGGSAVQKHPLQQLIATLKSPNTPQQRAQVLQDFIKARQAFQMAQAENQNQAANADQALLQLEAVLKLPDTPEKRAQIQQLLKDDPELQVAYISYETERLHMS